MDLNLATHGGHGYADFVGGGAAFDVVEGDFYGTGRRNNYGVPTLLEGGWSLEEVPFDTGASQPVGALHVPPSMKKGTSRCESST